MNMQTGIILGVAVVIVVGIAIYLASRPSPVLTPSQRLQASLSRETVNASTPISLIDGSASIAAAEYYGGYKTPNIPGKSDYQEATYFGGWQTPTGIIYGDKSQMYPSAGMWPVNYYLGSGNARPWYSTSNYWTSIKPSIV